MFNSRSKLPTIVTVIYLTLSVGAFVLMFATMATDNMAAIFAIAVSLPWSSLLLSLFDASASNSVALNTILMAIAVVINACILYVLFSFMTRNK